MTLTFLRGRDVVFFLWQVLGDWTEEKRRGREDTVIELAGQGRPEETEALS